MADESQETIALVGGTGAIRRTVAHGTRGGRRLDFTRGAFSWVAKMMPLSTNVGVKILF